MNSLPSSYSKLQAMFFCNQQLLLKIPKKEKRTKLTQAVMNFLVKSQIK